jgi:hypothetical protein
MAPKGKKAANSSQKAEDEHDEPLQAVVLADSYETRFAPFSIQVPRVGDSRMHFDQNCLRSISHDYLSPANGNESV